MADLAAVLQELDMAQYLPSFIHNGFDSWADVLDITKHDLDVLGVKLGHRRRLQQRVARERGLLSQTQPGQSCQFDGLLAHEAAPRKKRKYRWHPKPNPNAPKKPLTAYAQFANEKRRELRHHGLSFADMAIEIGKLWRELPDHEKKEAQSRAIRARDEYKEAVSAYRTTDEFREYERYLRNWKSKRYSRKTIVPENISTLSGYSGDLDLDSTTSPSTETTRSTTHNLNFSEEGSAPNLPWLLPGNNGFESSEGTGKFIPPAIVPSMPPETTWWTTSLQSDGTFWSTTQGEVYGGGFNASTPTTVEDRQDGTLPSQCNWMMHPITDQLA